MKKIYLYMINLLCLLTNSSTSFALPDDRSKIMQLSAGSADLDQQNHRGVYINDVQMDQGTSHIRAAKAVTEGDSNHQLTKAIIQGNHSAQAHFWTTTDITKPPMHAHANTINYYPDRHLIELIGNARVEQGKDSLFAPKISYDTLHQHVISQGNDKGRTMIIIHPDHYHE